MEGLIQRVRDHIDLCWISFTQKVGNRLIDINKEASMQLNFAYLLRSNIELVLFESGENVKIELETGIEVNGCIRECDILIEIIKDDQVQKLPIELKCYKKKAASGGNRGALDIFFKDVYVDLELLEAYEKNQRFLRGIHYIMTDYKHCVFPNKKVGKFWDYDISNGVSVVNGIHLTTPIGGKEINLRLTGSYNFIWEQIGGFYFTCVENEN